MKRRLITSNINSLISSSEENIFLGDWCFVGKNIQERQNFNFKKIRYHFNEPNKLKKDYKYLNNLYPKILIALSNFLNDFHKTNYSKRYWEIVIGPTLVQLLSVFWDRWELINKAVKTEKIDCVPVVDYKIKDFISQDFNDIFTNKLDSHFWNNCIFAEIINESHKLNILKIENKNFNNQSDYVNQDLESSHRFKFFDKILSKFTNETNLIYKLNLGNKNFLKYVFYHKKIFRSYSEFSKKIKLEKPIERNFFLGFDTKNNFEKMISKKLLFFFPLSHLEGFKNVQTEARKIKLNPKYIITAFGHVVNDLFKIWVAEKVEGKKSKLIISSHGGYVQNPINFNSWTNISDKFISWEKLNTKKTIQLPPLYLRNNKKKIIKKNKQILFCTSNTNLYAYRIEDYIISAQILECLKLWKNFFLSLDDGIKDKIIIRHVPGFDPWRQKDQLSKIFKHNAISRKKEFIDELKVSKIVINTSMQTTFFESMDYGVPTLVLLKDDLWNLSKKGMSIYKNLKKNNIIFTDFKKLNKHLIKIYDQPNLWWNQKKIVEVREEFHQHYCKKKNFDDWNQFFSKLDL